MPLHAATRFPTSGKRTVKYKDALGRTFNAVATDTSYWLANTGVDYAALTTIGTSIDGGASIEVDVSAALNLANVVTSLNADVGFSAVATASDQGGQLQILVDGVGEHSVSVTGVPGAQLFELFIGRQYPLQQRVPLATSENDTEAYYNRGTTNA